MKGSAWTAVHPENRFLCAMSGYADRNGLTDQGCHRFVCVRPLTHELQAEESDLGAERNVIVN
jgi:hypothetical protein